MGVPGFSISIAACSPDPDPGDSRPSGLKKRRFARIRAGNSLAAAQAFTMASKHQAGNSSPRWLVLTL
jgi:hypothetical protein